MQRTVHQMIGDADALSIAELEAFSRRFNYLKNVKNSPLLRLPGEIRNQIWGDVLIAELQDQKQHWVDGLKEILIEERKKQRLYNPDNVSTSHLRTLARAQYRTDWAHKLMFSPQPPIVFNVCRQLKHEAVCVFYAEVMVLMEVRKDVGRWKRLKPWQVSALSAVGGFHLRHRTVLMGNRRRRDGTFPTLKECVAGLKHGRFGIVMFAKELQIPPMAWTAALSLITDFL